MVLVVHTISYICDSMSKRYHRKGIVSTSTYMSFIGVRLGIKGRILLLGLKKNQSTPRPPEHAPVMGGKMSNTYFIEDNTIQYSKPVAPVAQR